jgi:hypothetical protein
MDVITKLIILIISWIAFNLATNPRNGGRPPKDITLTINIIFVVLCHLDIMVSLILFVFVLYRIRISPIEITE